MVDWAVRGWVWDGNNPLHEWVVQADDFQVPLKVNIQNTEPFIGAEKELLTSSPSHVPPNQPLTNTKQLTTWVFEPETFEPILKLSSDQNYSIINDPTGTPNYMVDANGKLVWSSKPDIYVDLRDIIGGRAECPFRSQGQYDDIEAELYYNRFRYYDPKIGTYISQDPSGLLGGFNLLSFVQDPNSRIDPLGLVELYALIAEKDGKYDVYEWGKKEPVGKIKLKKGSIWKYGETRNPSRRYSSAFLKKMGLSYRTLAKGNKNYVKAWEKYYLTRYQQRRKRLPPGNKCRH